MTNNFFFCDMCLKWLVKSLNPFFKCSFPLTQPPCSRSRCQRAWIFPSSISSPPLGRWMLFIRWHMSLGGRMCVGKVVCITELHINDDTWAWVCGCVFPLYNRNALGLTTYGVLLGNHSLTSLTSLSPSLKSSCAFTDRTAVFSWICVCMCL